MIPFTDIFLIALFCAVVLIYEMISRGIVTIENLQAIFSGNLFLYIIFAGAFIYFCQQQTRRNNGVNLEIITHLYSTETYLILTRTSLRTLRKFLRQLNFFWFQYLFYTFLPSNKLIINIFCYQDIS